MLKYSKEMRIGKTMAAVISLMLILVTAISYIAPGTAFAEGEEEKKADKKDKKQQAAVMPEVSSSSYIVMSGSTSEVVVDHRSERKMQPGSITMLMTAMVVIDNMYNDRELQNTVDISDEIAALGDTFKAGETVSVGDLLTAMLVAGDVQAAEALSVYSASSRDIFINEMNSKCMELGIMDTQFTNAGGRYDTKQYSTAADLAVIAQAAIRYQKIKDAFTLGSAKITASAKKGEREIKLKSSDPLLTGADAYKYIKGGISGSLGDAVNATQFAAIATKDDMQLIIVLMDSKKEDIAAEASGLFEYADTKVTKNTIVKKDKKAGHVKVKGGASTRVAAYTETKGYAYVPPEGSDALVQTQVVMQNGLEAPLKKGEKVGEFRIYVADELKGTVDLIIKKDVPEGWPPSKLYIPNWMVIALGAAAALTILFLLRVQAVKKKRARRRAALRKKKIRELAVKQMEMEAAKRQRDRDH